MVCRTPNTNPISNNMARRKRQVEPLEKANFGFIIADVENLLMWSDDNNVTLERFPDPEYYPFEGEIIDFGNIINIKVCLKQCDIQSKITVLLRKTAHSNTHSDDWQSSCKTKILILRNMGICADMIFVFCLMIANHLHQARDNRIKGQETTLFPL